MSAPSMDIDAARRHLLSLPTTPAFDPTELEGLPEPVRRYFSRAIAPGTAVATAVSLRMRGHIKPIELNCSIDDDGQITSVVFDRWGDPEETGTPGWHPFGGEVTDHRCFDGVTVPNAGSWGWFYGTSRWPEGEFFRCRITAHRAG